MACRLSGGHSISRHETPLRFRSIRSADRFVGLLDALEQCCAKGRYRLALQELGALSANTLFVAGSGFDMFGTAAVGLDTFWHNRAGLALPAGTPAPLREARTLSLVPELAATPIRC
jgi:hypothetical protein